MKDQKERIDDWAMSLHRICQYEKDAHNLLNGKDYTYAEQALRRIMVEAKYAIQHCQKQIYGEVPPWD